MLDQGLRTAILSLQAKGHGIRQIARALQISRGTVRTVLHAGSATVPRIERAEKAEPHREQILDWVDRCRGNLVRVHEELIARIDVGDQDGLGDRSAVRSPGGRQFVFQGSSGE